MATRLLWQQFYLLLIAVFLTAAATLSADEDKSKALPAQEEATPAIDPAKVADNIFLRVKDTANRTKSMNNLKQIVLALHNYTDANNKFPDDVLNKDGKPILSWRVLLLPYIEQQNLYMQFKLDEPWDSKNNLPLLEKMPKVYESPRVKVKRKDYTVYQVFTGPNALFNAGKSKYKTFAHVIDGTSNTIFAVEATKAVPWTKPADIPFDKDKDVPDFGKAYGGKPLVAMMDGSVRVVDLKKVKPETLKNAIMPADGNVLGKDWND